MVKKGGKLPEIMLAWNTRQDELKNQGLQDKEIANVAIDRRKNKDLDKLIRMGGTFTSAAAVDEYVADTDSNQYTKVERLYLEVRYARDITFPVEIKRPISPHERPQEVPINTYAANLKLYLKIIISNAEVTMEDFNEAMDNSRSLSIC